MKQGRHWLYLVLAAGVIALGAGGGTFASFNAQTTNKTNTFSTGSLVLTDNHGTACTSSSGTNNQKTCTGILTVSTAPYARSTSVAFKTVTLKNGGTLTASKFYLSATTQQGSAPVSPTSGTKQCVTSKAGTITVGTLNKTASTYNNLCTKLVLFVEETAQTTGTTKFSECWWGNSAGSGATCAATATLTTPLVQGTTYTKLKVKTLIGKITSGQSIVVTTGSHTEKFTAAASATPGASVTVSVTAQAANAAFAATTTQVLDVTQLTSSKTVAAFDTAHTAPSALKGVRLVPLSASGTKKVATSAPDLTNGKARTFRVGVYLATLTNKYQGLASKFALAWHITQ